MEKIIIEVGSTVTKADYFNGKTLKKLTGKTIEFKKHYLENNALDKDDILELINYVNELKNICSTIYVCGTSIFRALGEDEKKIFLQKFKSSTGLNFDIISQDEESRLTVFGATRFVKEKVCVLIGGGGSTEIVIFDGDIKETINSKFGVIDVMQKFPDLADNIATSNLEDVKNYVKSKINLPTEKADILILAGGEHQKFARVSKIKFEDNSLYNDPNSPIMMDIDTRNRETQRYYKNISLDEIRGRVADPKWWYATRAMCAVVMVVAEAVGAKFVVPTDISMVFGLLNKNQKNEE